MDMQSTQDREDLVHETAKTICECVNNLLTDIDAVHTELQKDTGNTPQSQFALQFLHHCVDALPDCYLMRPPAEHTKSPNVSDEQKKHFLSKDFSCWVLSRLLRILASPECSVLHTKSVSVITSILTLVKTKDLTFYRKLIIEFMGLYQDVLDVAEDYFSRKDNEEFFNATLYCGRFQERLVDDIGNDLMPPKLIELKDYLATQYLLKSVSVVLEENYHHIQQFMTDYKVTLFTLATRTIQLSDVSLILVSLKLLKCIVETFHSLPSHLFSQYAIILTSCLEYVMEDASLIKDWLPSLKCAFMMIVKKNVDDSLINLIVKKLTLFLNVNDKVFLIEETVFCLLSTILERFGNRLEENSSAALVQICTDIVGKKFLSKDLKKSFYGILRHFLVKQQTQTDSCSAKVILEEKLKELQDLVKKSKNRGFVSTQISGINLILRLLLSSYNSSEMKELLKNLNIETFGDMVLSIFSTELSRKNANVEYCFQTSIQTLDYMINAYKAFKLADIEHIDILRKFLEISSLPWLQSIDPPWFDFKPVAYKESILLGFHRNLKSCFDKKIIGRSLKLISLLGKHFQCTTWLSHIFRSALGNTSVDIQVKAIHYFPLFLLSNGSKCHGLIGEEIATLARSGVDKVQEAVGKIMKDLICIVSKNAKIELCNGRLSLTCKLCLSGERNSCINGNGEEISPLFKPFFQLYKQKTSMKFKISILNVLKIMFNHMSENDRVSSSSMSIWKACMDLLKDPEFEIRFAFCSSMGDFLNGFKNVSVHQLAIDNLSDTFSRAAQVNDIAVMETIVLTMGHVGKSSKGDLLSVMVVSLYNCFITQNKFIAAIASDQIHQIAKIKKITCQQLFIDHKNQLSDISVKKFLKLLEDGKVVQSVTETFFDIAKLFEFSDVKTFLEATATEMLPKLVHHASPLSSIILRLFAKYLQQDRREMMVYNFKYIFSYLVRTISKEAELETCLRYLQNETDVDLNSLLRSECQSVFNQLILYLSVNREQVFQGFAILTSNDSSYQGPEEFRSDSDIAVLLHHKLLAVLAFFNSVLTNSPNYEKKIALKSILCLLNIMGPKYLTPVRFKVMAILKLILRFKDDFPELCCSAWDCFVRNIEVECLGALLGQIFATLLPLVEICSSQVAVIFTFLVIENRSSLSPFFKDIYFIPDNTALSKVKRIVEASHVTMKSMKDFKTQILSILKGIRSENEDVQKFALMKICNLLEENSHYLEELLTSTDAIDSSIKELINTLLHSCKERNKDIFDLVGKCFGLLGAIDPGRIENSSEDVTEEVNLNNDLSDINFGCDVISELCRSFLAANDTRAQDCAAFAMQEILQYYGCTDQYTDSPGYQLWLKFPNSTQELLYPHLQSKYINSTVYNWSKHSLPIYGSVKGSTYKEWVCNWTNYMIYKLDDGDAAKVFKPCMSIIKHDLRMALFLLPHVVLRTILADNIDFVLTDVMTILQSVNDSEVSEFMKACTQTVFSVMDLLNSWSTKARFSRTITSSSDSESVAKDILSVHTFLENIPKDILALSSFHCSALSRSLMYYEQHVSVSKDDLEDHLEFLQKIYYSLDETDGIAGIAATRKRNTTLNEQIIEHECSGNLRDAVACYERAIQTDPDNVKHHKGFLNCLIRLGQLNNALMDVAGVKDKRSDWHSELQPYQAEVAWRLGQWDILNSVVKQENLKTNWSTSLGQLLLFLKDKDEENFAKTLSLVRSEQTQCLLSASLESGGYQRAYSSIIRLHMLADVERCCKHLFNMDVKRSNIDILSKVDHRLDLMESSFKSREAVLSLRRVLLNFLPSGNLHNAQDNGWLKTAKIARKDGLFQTAYSSLLNVNENNQSDILIEKANWFACQKDLHNALLSLQKGSPSLVISTQESNHYAAKISLLKARWMEETEYYEVEPVLAQYKDAVDKHNEWEKGHFCLAKYYEKLMTVWSNEKDGKKTGRDDFIRFVIKHYGVSLQYGSKYIYQSMPRLLTLWLDFGHDASQIIEGNGRQSEKTKYKEKMLKLNEEIVKFSKVLPAYQFLTAFSQLVSRICHTNFKVWNILKVIICKIFRVYRQQAIWNMVAVYKSSITTRSERCKQIFHEVCAEDPTLKPFIQHCLELTDQLLDVCNRRVGKENRLSMKRDFPPLVRLINNQNFSEIILPLQSTLTVQLPSFPDPQQQHNPFAESLPMITGVDDTVDVLSSLQKPKKICVKASNGCSYTLMCKPKDDLRKDSRLMEFNSLVNKLLLRDADCRRRQLHIRTYAVIPLNEECGLLEWVPNTSGLRYIIHKIYKEKGIVIKIADLKLLYEAIKRGAVKTKIDIFVNKVLPLYPAVFQQWFLNNFSDPTKWYTARLAYCRTSAVMSMVGYTLGLGDRHGENILFDSVSGDCVHVDFNCLFNKGETFDWPEKVPFRLTNNMVQAMGPLRYEGIFRKSCEMTMKLMRQQRDSLLSVLNTFLYDPLVEWKKESRKKGSGETSNEMAVKILKDVETRLKGYRSSSMIHLPLSIEGQVHQLIKESTDLEYLASMYIGWAAYM